MLRIILIVLLICFLAVRIGRSSKKEEINEEVVGRIRQSEARAAVARCQMMEERNLRNAEQKLLKESIRRHQQKRVPKAKVVKSVVPELKRVTVPEMEPPDADWGYDEEGDDASSSGYTFSPDEWWDKNYKNVVQETPDTFRINASFLPSDKSQWAQVGVYLINNEGFADFSIWDDSITLKMN